MLWLPCFYKCVLLTVAGCGSFFSFFLFHRGRQLSRQLRPTLNVLSGSLMRPHTCTGPPVISTDSRSEQPHGAVNTTRLQPSEASRWCNRLSLPKASVRIPKISK